VCRATGPSLLCLCRAPLLRYSGTQRASVDLIDAHFDPLTHARVYFSRKNSATGSSNIAVGATAGTNLTGSNNIDIGAPGVAGESGVIRIGKSSTATGTFIAGISGKTVASGVGVMINSSGQLGTVLSSARFKNDIKPMDNASEGLLKLKPVTFHYKEDIDPDGIPQFGLIAEQVEKVNPDLVARDEGGKVYTVRYDAVNAMLLNEFLKEHRKVEEQATTIAKMKKQIEALTATVAEGERADRNEPTYAATGG
jgi:Chaperone of endosialidase